jgi:hypothetical protein
VAGRGAARGVEAGLQGVSDKPSPELDFPPEDHPVEAVDFPLRDSEVLKKNPLGKAQVLGPRHPPGEDEALPIGLKEEHHAVPHPEVAPKEEHDTFPADGLGSGMLELPRVLRKHPEGLSELLPLHPQEADLEIPGEDEALPAPCGFRKLKEVPVLLLEEAPCPRLDGEVGELVGNEDLLLGLKERGGSIGKDDDGLPFLALLDSPEVRFFPATRDLPHRHLKAGEKGNSLALERREVVLGDLLKEGMDNIATELPKLSQGRKFPDGPLQGEGFPVRPIMDEGIKDVTGSKNPGLQGDFLAPEAQVPASVQTLVVVASRGDVRFHELVPQKDPIKLQDVPLHLFELLFRELPRFQEDFPRDEELPKIMDEAGNPHLLLLLPGKAKALCHPLGKASHPEGVVVGVGVDALKEGDKRKKEAIKDQPPVRGEPRPLEESLRGMVLFQGFPDGPSEVLPEEEDEKVEGGWGKVEDEDLFPGLPEGVEVQVHFRVFFPEDSFLKPCPVEVLRESEPEAPGALVGFSPCIGSGSDFPLPVEEGEKEEDS